MFQILVFILLIILGVISWLRGAFPGSRGRGLPPGPPCVPIVGNALQVPKTGIHLK